jgi:hypothetical protein
VVTDPLHDLLRALTVERGGDLVADDEPRRVGERAGDAI